MKKTFAAIAAAVVFITGTTLLCKYKDSIKQATSAVCSCSACGGSHDKDDKN